MMQQMLLGNSTIKEVEIGDWVPSQGGYYAGLITTGTESFDNLDPVGTQYHLYIAEKSVSQSLGQYKNARSCDGTHTYPGDTTAPNASWNGYFNTYQSVLANASSTTHPIFNAVQNISITVDGITFDDWYIPAHFEADFAYKNLKQSAWQNTSQGFDNNTSGTSSQVGEVWTSSGDSCSNTGTFTTASKYFPHQSGNGDMVYGFYKDDTAVIRPIRRVPAGTLTGQVAYTTPGTYTWTAPANITSVCVVCVGGGGGSVTGDNQGSSATPGGAGGGGGGLGWKNNISVTPEQTYTVVVGAGGTGIQSISGDSAGNGGDSYFINTSTVKGDGGQGGQYHTAGTGGSYTGDGGGNGGNAADRQNGGGGGGGGGAGGYSGNGGNAGTQSTYGTTQFIAGSSGSGGAGGGASSGWGSYAPSGGGTDIYGQGVNGQGGTGGDSGTGGCQGSNVDGTQTVTTEYGGGAGGGVWSGTYDGGPGAVRIIWGQGRAFPSTHTGDL